jgi:peptidoglycan/xylan/chitin deacetylase (PgdA/CDA1 family)
MPGPRFDRLLTLKVFRPLRKLAPGGNGQRLPILMYHSISTDAEKHSSPYYRVCTSPAVFARHMELLHEGGYQAINMRQASEFLTKTSGSFHRRVVITFDDGFRDFYTAAFPVLQKYNFSATMFLPTVFIGSQPRQFKEKECLTWDEVRECDRAGIEFGSHTVNHPKLYELDFPQIRVELETSKKVIEQELGKAAPSFAYPYAFPSGDRAFVKKFTELLRGAGYETNVTTRIGTVRAGDDPFTLRRLPANSDDDASLFMAKIHGAYDWLGRPQDTLKKLKHLLSGQRVLANQPN